MKKIVLLGLIGIAGLMGVKAEAQLLYRISGKELKNPSYIVGTYHLAPGTFADKIAGLKEALGDCKQIYGELDMREVLANPEKMAEMEKLQMLPDGLTLSKLLDKEQMKRLNALMRETLGADMSNPAMAQLDKMTPATISTTLTIFAYMKKTTDFNPMNLLDAHLQTMAAKQGLEVKGFETIEFQSKVLYGTPLDQQVEDLMCLVDNFDKAIKMAETVTNAYFEQDLEKLLELELTEEEGPCASDPEQNETLIYDRNRNWVKAMSEIMGEAPTFFAVGAAHLCGDQGVLHLLKMEGYNVEAVR